MNEVIETDVDDNGTGEKNSDGECSDFLHKGSSGPWKKADSSAVEPEAPPPEVQQPQPPPAATALASKNYKAPAFRNPQLNAERSMTSGRLRSKNIAPDINSERYFPTLNSKQPVSNKSGGAWSKK
jgi:hypothetical protein